MVEISHVPCTILLCPVGNLVEALSFAQSSWILMSSPSIVSGKVAYGYILNGQAFDTGNVADGSITIKQRPALYLIKRTPNRFYLFILTCIKMQHGLQRIYHIVFFD